MDRFTFGTWVRFHEIFRVNSYPKAMNATNPTVTRYRNLRQNLNRLPADRDGQVMNLEHMDVPEENGIIGSGSFIDNDSSSVDIIHLSKNREKGTYQAETFVEITPKVGFWQGIKDAITGAPKPNQRLMHLSRQVAHVSGGYNLTDVALQNIDLVTGVVKETFTGAKAVKAAQGLEDQIPYRIHTIEPKGLERKPENWLKA